MRADSNRRKHYRPWWSRNKGYVELTLIIVVITLLILAGIHYEYYSALK